MFIRKPAIDSIRVNGRLVQLFGWSDGYSASVLVDGRLETVYGDQPEEALGRVIPFLSRVHEHSVAA